MDDDFIISRRHGGWQIVAVSERGKAFAAADPRFVRDETVVKPAEALFLYHEFHERGYYSRTPDGLPPGRPGIDPVPPFAPPRPDHIPVLIFMLLA